MSASTMSSTGLALAPRTGESGHATRVMRVLIVAPNIGEFGGIEAFVFRLASELSASAGIGPVICFKRVKGFEMQPSLERSLITNEAPVVFVERASLALLRQIHAADIVHSQNASIDVALMAAVLRTPHVTTIHGWRRQRRTPRAILKRLAATLALRRLYNSDFVWRTWEPNGPRPGSGKLPIISHLPLGSVDPGHRRGFVFVGRWIPNKGIEVLIEAYQRARVDRDDWPLTLIGDGPLRPPLEAEIAARRIEGIEVTGYVDDQTRNDRIRHAKWLVAPPHTTEELGLTPIEARHVGVPCIVTRDGGLLEAGGLFSLSCEPGDVTGLARLLEYAASMEDACYARLAEATKAELDEYLAPMSAYVELYRELLADQRRQE
jgi:glycosyltransferase involved in cell wall biosynthesis